MKKDLIAN